MNCPACGNTLKQIVVSDVAVDVCEGGCGGIWFDNYEIKKFDEPHEYAGDEILDIRRDESLVVDKSQQIKCPNCDDVVMMRHFFSVKKEVEVDECPGCGGFWLDAGELAKIRSLFENEEERQKAAEEYFAEMFGDELNAMEAEGRAKFEKAQRVANIFRFVCPSYYIPGKQDWGAF